MRFLHTSDWHIGKTLYGRHREAEYEAALAELLDIARAEEVDCVLVAGDVFDSAAPSPEAERLVYEFCRELWGAKIRAVIIAGNHDHPRRFAAVSRLLEVVDIRLLGEPVTPEQGGVIEMPSRDKSESALIAALPWVTERRVVAFEDLLASPEQPIQQYADRVAAMLEYLCSGFRPDTVNVLLAHVLIDGADIGPGGGERQLHLGQAYAVNAQRLPANAQYIALGHIHRPQEMIAAAKTSYPGSLLQLDFGETQQEKSTTIVDVHPGRPVKLRRLPLHAGRPLRTIEGSLAELGALASDVGDAYLKVTVRLDAVTPNWRDRVRDLFPDALFIQHLRPETSEEQQQRSLMGLGPAELFAAFCRNYYGETEVPEPLSALFRQLHAEETHASAAS